MFEKLGAVINLFRKGHEVTNVELWKSGGISVAALATAIGALVQFGDAFGVRISITPEQLNGLAIGIISLVGIVLPTITSKRAGILPAKADQPAPIEDHSNIDGMPAMAEATAPALVQPEHKPLARVAGELVDSDNPLAGLDTTYRG